MTWELICGGAIAGIGLYKKFEKGEGDWIGWVIVGGMIILLA